MSLGCMVYSCMLYYYILLYSYRSLDLVLCSSMRYTIVLCFYMYLYMYDSLILYDCYIYLFSLYFSLCSYRKCWKSAKHRTLVCLIVYHGFMVLSSGIDKSYGKVGWYRVKLYVGWWRG